MNGLRVLFLGDRAGYHAKIVKEFNNQGHHAFLVLFTENEFKYLKNSGNIQGVPYIFAPQENINNSRTLLKYIKKYKPDVIHSYCFFSLLRTSLRLSIPWLIQFFGSDLRKKTLPVRTKILLRLFRLKKNSFFSITTPDLLEYVHDAFFIPHPIEVDFWKPLDVPIKKRTIFFPHRFDDTKGVDFIFTAWEELKDHNVHLRLINWGYRIQEFKKLYGENNVSYLPFMTKEKLRDEINESSLIWGQFLPNYSPQIEQEALACGKNVLGARMEEFPIEYSIPTIKCSTPQDLVENTLKALELPSAQPKNREWVMKLHSSRTVILKIIEFYREKGFVN